MLVERDVEHDLGESRGAQLGLPGDEVSGLAGTLFALEKAHSGAGKELWISLCTVACKRRGARPPVDSLEGVWQCGNFIAPFNQKLAQIS
jgi:hypothetical protein